MFNEQDLSFGKRLTELSRYWLTGFVASELTSLKLAYFNSICTYINEASALITTFLTTLITALVAVSFRRICLKIPNKAQHNKVLLLL